MIAVAIGFLSATTMLGAFAVASVVGPDSEHRKQNVQHSENVPLYPK